MMMQYRKYMGSCTLLAYFQTIAQHACLTFKANLSVVVLSHQDAAATAVIHAM